MRAASWSRCSSDPALRNRRSQSSGDASTSSRARDEAGQVGVRPQGHVLRFHGQALRRRTEHPGDHLIGVVAVTPRDDLDAARGSPRRARPPGRAR